MRKCENLAVFFKAVVGFDVLNMVHHCGYPKQNGHGSTPSLKKVKHITKRYSIDLFSYGHNHEVQEIFEGSLSVKSLQTMLNEETVMKNKYTQVIEKDL